MLLLLLFSNLLAAQQVDQGKLDEFLNHISRNNLGAGSLSVFKDGKQVYNKDFGQENISSNLPETYKYQVGSVTKLVTATLIFKLVEAGKLSLDDKLSNLFPKVPNAAKISIGHLLAHTSGLGSYVVKDGEVWVTENVTEKEIFDLIAEQGVSFQPGEKVSYSNTAYYLLAKIVEAKYKMPYHKVVEQEIIKPLKLKSLASIKSGPENVLKPYQFKDANWTMVKDINFVNVIGVGDICATPEELNIFMENLFRYKLINKSSLEKMLPVIGRESWGRGIAEWDFEGLKFYGHGGDTLGSHAILIYDPKTRLSIAYTTNAERIKKEEFMAFIVKALQGKAFDYPTKG